MIWDFFARWTQKELAEQKQRTEKKINEINKMLSGNPDNIFLASQKNCQLEKLKAIDKNLKK